MEGLILSYFLKCNKKLLCYKGLSTLRYLLNDICSLLIVKERRRLLR